MAAMKTYEYMRMLAALHSHSHSCPPSLYSVLFVLRTVLTAVAIFVLYEEYFPYHKFQALVEKAITNKELA
jgi:heme/copper-type cytochrome/quinol oxidase subunit 4